MAETAAKAIFLQPPFEKMSQQSLAFQNCHDVAELFLLRKVAISIGETGVLRFPCSCLRLGGATDARTFPLLFFASRFTRERNETRNERDLRKPKLAGKPEAWGETVNGD